MRNDISLLQITDNEFNFDDEDVKPICEPQNITYDGYQMIVSGWGTTSSGGVGSANLRYAAIYGINNTECSQYFSLITGDMICANSNEGR